MTKESSNAMLPTDISQPGWKTRLAAANPITMAAWLLRIAVVIHATTIFLMVFSAKQTQFNNLFFLDIFHIRDLTTFTAITGMEIIDQFYAARFVERVTVSIFLFAALWVLIKPHTIPLLFITFYVFLEAYAGYHMAGYRFSEWTILAHCLRYSTPLALILLCIFPCLKKSTSWRTSPAVFILRLATAAVFFSHGLLCLKGDGRFIDYIIGTGRHLAGLNIAESSALAAMQIIGWVDMILAGALLLLPHPIFLPRRLFPTPKPNSILRHHLIPSILIWMAFWGFITALSRMTALGFKEGRSEYYEVLLRSSHYLAPIALLYLLIAQWRIDDQHDAEIAENIKPDNTDDEKPPADTIQEDKPTNPPPLAPATPAQP